MTSVVREIRPLGFPWQTVDPFLFCVHHDDAYPAGNAQLGPAASLAGRDIGQDFAGIDGWRMYHGDVVPGFPQHPHRGFETVTIVRRGFIDHSDSLGATARFGAGDTQWLTAGAGIVHSEMFPLLREDVANPLELFQIWLNLPRAEKLAPPHFAMLWNAETPRVQFSDAAGLRTEVTLVAGELGDRRAPAPPPRSWAARADSHVAIWQISLQAGARWQLPAAAPQAQRTLYFFRGSELRVAGQTVPVSRAIALAPGVPVELESGELASDLLLLQGRPIGEPVVQYGPFVMNNRAEIQQAMQDYQRTGFGGWPWPADGPVHERTAGRFARHVDGRIENPA
ncbi:MAG TPA: pirin family protein [Polyangiales bacterium]|nr:pirin family protein [Polyangiales bacterium]